jgi:hypothetical protein
MPVRKTSKTKKTETKTPKVKKTGHILTAEQSAIKDALNTDNNIIVVARAGTGKSSTIEAIAPRGSVILCFNKAPADEMAERLGSGREASTFHKFGMALMPKGSWMDKGGFGMRERIQTVAFRGNKPTHANEYKLQSSIANSVSWLMTMAAKPDISLEDAMKILRDEGYGRLQIENPVEEVVEHAVRVLQLCAERTKGRFGTGFNYNFDMMLWLPYINGWGAGSVDNLFVDEAQDTNPLRMALALQWGNRIVAVGDDRQAIYAFNGSMSDSLSLLQEKTQAVQLPLTCCWRCPSTHLDMARAIVPDIKDRPYCIPGEIINGDGIEYDQLPEDGVLIMSRTNAPLIRHFLRMRKEISNQKVVFFASEGIANSMKSLIGWNLKGSFDASWRHQFDTKLDKSIVRCPSAMAKAVLLDYKQCIIELYDANKFNTVKEVHDFLDEEFKKPDESAKDPAYKTAIKLSSIHSSKGLEHNKTIIYGTSSLPHPLAKKPWEKMQESNLEYVALTRSKQSMTLIPCNGSSVESEEVGEE